MAQAGKSKSQSTPSVTGVLNYGQGSYLESTRRPLYALCFLLPLIILYELGTIGVNTEQIHQSLVQTRVVAFIWLMNLAEWIGMHHSLAWAFPGFVVVIILLCWHLASSYPWHIRFGWIGAMGLECFILTLPLLAINAAIGSSAQSTNAFVVLGTSQVATSNSFLAYLVTSIGAGIYEELVFRLILVGLIIVIMEDLCKVKSATATIIAVFISAALFGAHHYLGFKAGELISLPGETFTIVSFIFRTAAGVYFAIIFHYRGYGIAAGTHAAYNIILRTIWS